MRRFPELKRVYFFSFQRMSSHDQDVEDLGRLRRLLPGDHLHQRSRAAEKVSLSLSYA
jgi:hypothetical protein